MSTKRILSIVLVASAVLLAVGIGPRFAGTARALPPAQEPEPPGATIPYPGHLTDEAGQPVADGAYAFTFALYDAPDGGTLLWSETQTDVVVQGGGFTALLGSASPLPAAAKDGKLWLAVGVRGPGEGEFTLLSPRQQLNAAAPLTPASPAAGPACAHDHLGESWSGSYATYGLRVNNSGTGDAIRGYTNATAQNYAALYGVSSSTGTGVYGRSDGGGLGVYGESNTNDGVAGQASAANKSGVYGENTGSGYGVFGRSTTGFGMGASGDDSSPWDRVGDLILGGGLIGEIFAFGSNGMNLFSDEDVYIDLDDNNNDANACWKVYDGANAIVGRTCEDGTKSAVLQTESYDQRAVYTVESPEVWLEDFDTASLVAGEATVAFESIFAETVNLEEDYHVFVTPLCDQPVLLFVTAKTSTGFTVQGVELDGDPSTCDFDYHVTAKRLGLEDLRLEAVPATK